MLTDDEIKDDGWRDELAERFGWMGGGYLSFEHLGGWRFIMRDLLERIDATLRDEDRGSFCISQIKEKWAELRVAHNGGAGIDRLVDAAEAASRITCDVCSGRGRVQGTGWISTRCAVHEDWRG
ncbi:hypothetical protein ACFOYU_06140 [Microvirga sp. GCM10011540]|uniref:hypothetical protein n=1 Tax=Microvirga sp. GCM10011540 TaxID=3317338 RepID=UPI003610C469